VSVSSPLPQMSFVLIQLVCKYAIHKRCLQDLAMEAPPTCQPTTLPMLFKMSLPLGSVRVGGSDWREQTDKEKTKHNEHEPEDKGNKHKRKRTAEEGKEVDMEREGAKKLIRMEEAPTFNAPRLRVDVVRVFHMHHW